MDGWETDRRGSPLHLTFVSFAESDLLMWASLTTTGVALLPMPCGTRPNLKVPAVPQGVNIRDSVPKTIQRAYTAYSELENRVICARPETELHFFRMVYSRTYNRWQFPLFLQETDVEPAWSSIKVTTIMQSNYTCSLLTGIRLSLSALLHVFCVNSLRMISPRY